MADYELRLTDEVGEHLQTLLPEQFAWSIVKHDVGVFQGVFSAKWASYMKDTRRIEVWRAQGVKAPLLMRSYFIRGIADSTDGQGKNRIEVVGYDGNYLLDSSLVAYSAGSSQAEKQDYPAEMMTEIVAECLGASSPDPLDPTWFSIAATVAAPAGYTAVALIKAFAWRNVLSVLREIADQTAGLAWDGSGYKVAFHIFDRDDHGFEFRTRPLYLGRDRRSSTARPTIFALEFGNLSSAKLSYDASEEINNAFIGGGGEKSARLIGEKTGGRATAGKWMRRKGFKDAVDLSTQASVDSAASGLLELNRPIGRFEAVIAPTQGNSLGYEWFFGDYVSAQYKNTTVDATVDALKVEVDSDSGERIDAKLEAYVW